MPRPKSPCGTYPAYQRHLRERTPVDAACRRAQQEHDAGRGRTWRDGDVERPVVVPVPIPSATSASTVDPFVRRRDEARARFRELSVQLTAAVDANNLYTVIDRSEDLDTALDAWVFAADEVDASKDFSDHPEDLRNDLIASWLETARDPEAGPDEISDELRASLLTRDRLAET